jgi:hypothetical protein
MSTNALGREVPAKIVSALAGVEVLNPTHTKGGRLSGLLAKARSQRELRLPQPLYRSK